MSLSSLVDHTLVLIVTLIQATSVDYLLQSAGGTIAVTGYSAAGGIHDARTVKEACHKNWTHARVDGLECFFAVAQTAAWHTFALTLGLAGGTAFKYYSMDH